MTNVKQDAILGVVFFAAIGLLLAVTLLLTNFSFKARPQLEVLFPGAAGLEKGDAVFVLGRRNGEVIDIGYRPGDRRYPIAVVLRLEEAVELRANPVIEITDANLLSGKRVEITPGDVDGPPPSPLVGRVRKSPIEAFGDEMQSDTGLVVELKAAVSKLNQREGTLGKLFNEPALHDALLGAADSLRASLDAIREGRSVVGRLVHDADLGEDVAAAVRSVRSVAAKADTGEGPLGVILNDTTVAGNLREIVGDVALMTRELRDGAGAAGYLLRDPEARSRVQSILADVTDLIAKTRTPDSGLLWALFSDTQMLADARNLLTSMREFADSASHGNGLLARLVNDPDWGRRFGQILGQTQRAIEDAREAAPVGTFFQVITGFF